MSLSAAGAGPEAQPSALPMPPSLRGSVRSAAADFLAHSWRLVVLNLAWGAALLALLVATAVTPLAWLLAPLLALPTVGVYRLAALVVRDEPVSIGAGFAAWGHHGGRALLVGAGLLGAGVVFGTNLVTGLEARGILGWSLATFAAWGLAATGVLAAITWPLLADPRRDGMRLRDILRLAVLLGLAHPLRFGALAAVLLALLVVSALAVVVVLTVAVGLAALVDCRYVLPAADRLATRLESRQAAT
jgi:hypothetical protein